MIRRFNGRYVELTPKQIDTLRFYAGLPQERYRVGRWPHLFTEKSLARLGLLGFDPCSIVRTGDFGTALTIHGLHVLAMLQYESSKP